MSHDRSFGLACRRDPISRMSVAHSHDDLEFNSSDVEIEYLVDGESFVVPAGSLAYFWAGRPHQLLSGTPGHQITWLTVPLVDAVGWRLPDLFLARMLGGEVAVTDATGPLDLVRHGHAWGTELEPDHPLYPAAIREIEALLLRAAVASAEVSANGRPGSKLRADVAAQAHLHPNYAMSVFRAALGVTIGDYLTQCRIGRAKQLLFTTSDSVGTIALETGFGSISQFYASFRRFCGTTPAGYRRRLGS